MSDKRKSSAEQPRRSQEQERKHAKAQIEALRILADKIDDAKLRTFQLKELDTLEKLLDVVHPDEIERRLRVLNEAYERSIPPGVIHAPDESENTIVELSDRELNEQERKAEIKELEDLAHDLPPKERARFIPILSNLELFAGVVDNRQMEKSIQEVGAQIRIQRGRVGLSNSLIDTSETTRQAIEDVRESAPQSVLITKPRISPPPIPVTTFSMGSAPELTKPSEEAMKTRVQTEPPRGIPPEHDVEVSKPKKAALRVVGRPRKKTDQLPRIDTIPGHNPAVLILNGEETAGEPPKNRLTSSRLSVSNTPAPIGQEPISELIGLGITPPPNEDGEPIPELMGLGITPPSLTKNTETYADETIVTTPKKERDIPPAEESVAVESEYKIEYEAKIIESIREIMKKSGYFFVDSDTIIKYIQTGVTSDSFTKAFVNFVLVKPGRDSEKVLGFIKATNDMPHSVPEKSFPLSVDVMQSSYQILPTVLRDIHNGEPILENRLIKLARDMQRNEWHYMHDLDAEDTAVTGMCRQGYTHIMHQNILEDWLNGKSIQTSADRIAIATVAIPSGKDEDNIFAFYKLLTHGEESPLLPLDLKGEVHVSKLSNVETPLGKSGEYKAIVGSKPETTLEKIGSLSELIPLIQSKIQQLPGNISTEWWHGAMVAMAHNDFQLFNRSIETYFGPHGSLAAQGTRDTVVQNPTFLQLVRITATHANVSWPPDILVAASQLQTVQVLKKEITPPQPTAPRAPRTRSFIRRHINKIASLVAGSALAAGIRLGTRESRPDNDLARTTAAEQTPVIKKVGSTEIEMRTAKKIQTRAVEGANIKHIQEAEQRRQEHEVALKALEEKDSRLGTHVFSIAQGSGIINTLHSGLVDIGFSSNDANRVVAKMWPTHKDEWMSTTVHPGGSIEVNVADDLSVEVAKIHPKATKEIKEEPRMVATSSEETQVDATTKPESSETKGNITSGGKEFHTGQKVSYMKRARPGKKAESSVYIVVGLAQDDPLNPGLILREEHSKKQFAISAKAVTERLQEVAKTSIEIAPYIEKYGAIGVEVLNDTERRISFLEADGGILNAITIYLTEREHMELEKARVVSRATIRSSHNIPDEDGKHVYPSAPDLMIFDKKNTAKSDRFTLEKRDDDSYRIISIRKRFPKATSLPR